MKEINCVLPPRLLILAQPGEQLPDMDDELLKAPWESPDTSGSSHFSEKKRKKKIKCLKIRTGTFQLKYLLITVQMSESMILHLAKDQNLDNSTVINEMPAF